MNMCPSNKRKTAPVLCLKGQVFFIWSNYQSLEIVKDRISLLGGKVDPFLSRDVTTVLVEDNHLVGSQLASNNLQVKPAYATNSTVVTSFPYQTSLCNVPSTSRGFNFLAASSSNSPYRVICYAHQWGIQVLGIDQFLTWIEPQVKTAITLKKKTSDNVSKLSGCFIKFESFYKNYRPCYKMFNNDPDRLLPLKNANVLIKPENCNIILDKPIVARQVHHNHINITPRVIHPAKNVHLPVKANDKKVLNRKVKPKEENNYCECCRTHFADLKNHIKSVKHQKFVSNEKNYESVHNIIKMLPTAQEFIDKLQNPSPDPGVILSNADIPNSMPVANTGCPVSVHLPIQRDNVHEMPMPIDLHVERGRTMPVVGNHIKNNEEDPLPLDLVKRVNVVKEEAVQMKEEISLLANLEFTNSCQKNDLDMGLSKEETKNSVNIKEEVAEDMHCDAINGDPLFDRSTTAALAQLCLKNFDSYWLDSLPCEMEDMVFDDIFDLDDGKTKIDNECPEFIGENFGTSEVAQTPGLVSGISTPSFKTPTNTNMSFCGNSSVDIKDIKSESVNLAESFPNSCKLDKGLDLLSSQNTIPANEPPVENKNKIFSIASYCQNKINVTPSCSSKIDTAAPSCSNAISNTNTETLFSSDSSDSENENVFISNVLNIINHNSDTDMKIDKESGEDNSLNAVSGQSALEQKASCTNRENDVAVASVTGLSIPDTPNLKMNITENPVLSNSSIEIMNQPKRSVPPNRASPSNVKVEHNFDKIISLRRDSAEMNKNGWPVDEELVPAKKLCSSGVGVDNLSTINFAAVELASNRCKMDAQPLNDCFQKNPVTNEIKIQSYDYKGHPVSVKPLSFAEMKMKISPKELAPSSTWPETKLYENTNKFISSEQSRSCEQNFKQISTSSQNSSDLIPSEGLVLNKVLNSNNNITPYIIKPSQEVFKQNHVQQYNSLDHAKSAAIRQDLYKNVCSKEIRPKHDFSIAHLTSNAGPEKFNIDWNDSEIKPCLVKKYHERKSLTEIPDLTQNSWPVETGVSNDYKNIPTTDRLSELKTSDACNITGSNAGNKAQVHKEESKAIPVLPKKAYGRKYKLYEDKKYISSNKIPSTELRMFEENNEKRLILDPKSSREIKMHEEKSLVLMGTKGKILCEEDKKCFVPNYDACETKLHIDTKNVTVDTKSPCISQNTHPKCSFKKQLKHRDVNFIEKKVAPVLVKKHGLDEGISKQREVTSILGSTNLCQYSKDNVNSSSQSLDLLAESSVSNHPVSKLPHEKSASKLQKLPPLWSVSILPGSGVKLKFSCIQQKLGNQRAEKH